MAFSNGVKREKFRMKKFIFIVGGARSGKSSYAVELAKKLKKEVVFVATAVESDSEMKERIKLHRLSRPKGWKLIEEPLNVGLALSQLREKEQTVLVDCLGVLISNLLFNDFKEDEIRKKVNEVVNAISKSKFTTIIVSNEVGTGIVPDNPLSRTFRDLIGSANQVLAKNADRVIYMQCGIPVTIKGAE